MLVCALLVLIAHETAGAACTRHSLHPLIEGDRLANLGRVAPRDREDAFGENPHSNIVVKQAWLERIDND
jgi:hypothetical protein